MHPRDDKLKLQSTVLSDRLHRGAKQPVLGPCPGDDGDTFTSGHVENIGLWLVAVKRVVWVAEDFVEIE